MGGLAHGGHGPVIIPMMMGVSAVVVGAIIDPLSGLVPLFGIFCLMLSAFFANFWRDPDRKIPSQQGIITSPADGHVMFAKRERAIGRRPSKKELESGKCTNDKLTGDWYPEPLDNPLLFTTEQQFEAVPKGEESTTDVWRIAVFMSPLDVHVNRAPMASTITAMEHRTGKGMRRGPFAAAFKKESQYNERVRSIFQSEDGTIVEVMQISGALARTIVPWVSKGATLRRGQRFGMIRLGSRVDVRVQASKFNVNVISAEDDNDEHPKGQFVMAGSSILYTPIE